MVGKRGHEEIIRWRLASSGSPEVLVSDQKCL
jgi:hypothetical protein